jgi:hypothetical protein
VLIVAESPIGFRRWMIEYPLEKTNIQHELGGARFVRLTREALLQSQAAPGRRRPPGAEDLLEEAMARSSLPTKTPSAKDCGLKGR